MAKRSNGEGTAPKQRKDGIWYRAIRIEGTGKRKYLYAGTRAELDKKYREFVKQIANGTYTDIRRQTVEEYLWDWLTVYKKIELKPKSYDTLESTIKYQILPFFKYLQFFSVTHDDVQKFINQMNDEGKSYSIIKKAYLALNAAYKHAMLKEQIVKNPCFGVKLPKKAEKNIKKICVLSKEEIKMYCECAAEKYANGRLIYRLGYGLILILFTGLRLGEAAGLRWEDIDFERQNLKVQRTLEYVKNRDKSHNANGYVLVEGTTKSKSGERTIPLNQTAVNALSELKKLNGEFDYVFSNAKGKPINPRNLNRAHDCILKKAGIKHIGIHALRHTFASQLFANKVDIKVISKLLGHSDVSVTYNIYIHLMQEDLPNATTSLDRIFDQ